MDTSIDESIKRRVLDHLYWDNRIDASDVKVEVNNRIIRLTGKVPSYSASESVLMDAWSIPQVTGVKNKLMVEYPSIIETPTDNKIASMISDSLSWNHSTSTEKIDVSVKSGIVTLEGNVDAYWKKFRAEQICSDVIGVIQIVNKIAVVPTRNILDEVIAKDITKAVDRS